MSDVLSPDEVNALLDKGAGDEVAPSPPSGVQPLDLMKQEQSVKGRLPGLDMILEQFARQFRVVLASTFGKPPEITVAAMEQRRFGPLQQSLTTPLGLHLFRLTPLRGQGLLVLPPAFLTAILQVSFGGDPKRSTPLVKQEFSAIELLLLNKWADKLLACWRDAWQPLEPIECRRVRTETNPLFAAIVGAQDIVLVIELRLTGEALEDVPLTVILPNASLDPIRPRLAVIGRPVEAEDVGGDAEWAARLKRALVEVEVEVAAELGRRAMPMQDVLALQVGDLITLGTGRDGPVLLKVGGRTRFVGTPGVSAGSHAVQVTSAA